VEIETPKSQQPTKQVFSGYLDNEFSWTTSRTIESTSEIESDYEDLRISGQGSETEYSTKSRNTLDQATPMLNKDAHAVESKEYTQQSAMDKKTKTDAHQITNDTQITTSSIHDSSKTQSHHGRASENFSPQVPHHSTQRRDGEQQVLDHQSHMPTEENLYTGWTGYDPRLALFSLEKSRSSQGWEKVTSVQHHIPLGELEDELNDFRRNHGSVRRILRELQSSGCRKAINNLVEDQTKQLWQVSQCRIFAMF